MQSVYCVCIQLLQLVKAHRDIFLSFSLEIDKVFDFFLFSRPFLSEHWMEAAICFLSSPRSSFRVSLN